MAAGDILVDEQKQGELSAESLAFLQPFLNSWFTGGSLKSLSIYRKDGKYFYIANGFAVKNLSTLSGETRIVGTVDEQGVAHPFE